ncbi:hypothetical protein BDP55DRAFT_626498 [Colletotrichum godetiae]|uniref:Uncharacterized protein n=1 Tax=Colletotrichum godetiae TaxID=1209918 RepID=A0AAJ0B180_9PEZI|nr:uncharacterized protein BDP55DRAFT_626498 [Colletotrichum godetiae]KAK1699802.1 hypothetical protein BDP55DRAFT_626498 [Colletotrichum godetiae]
METRTMRSQPPHQRRSNERPLPLLYGASPDVDSARPHPHLTPRTPVPFGASQDSSTAADLPSWAQAVQGPEPQRSWQTMTTPYGVQKEPAIMKRDFFAKAVEQPSGAPGSNEAPNRVHFHWPSTTLNLTTEHKPSLPRWWVMTTQFGVASPCRIPRSSHWRAPSLLLCRMKLRKSHNPNMPARRRTSDILRKIRTINVCVHKCFVVRCVRPLPSAAWAEKVYLTGLRAYQGAKPKSLRTQCRWGETNPRLSACRHAVVK